MRVELKNHVKPIWDNVVIELVSNSFSSHKVINNIWKTKSWLFFHKDFPPENEWGKIISVWRDCDQWVKDSVWNYVTFIRKWEPVEYDLNWSIYILCKSSDVLWKK
jgi:hypothetical protein